MAVLIQGRVRVCHTYFSQSKCQAIARVEVVGLKSVARFCSFQVKTKHHRQMETTVFEARARELVDDIKEIVKVKGINLTEALEEAGISRESSERILSKGAMPNLSEFLALCQISGITFHLPYVETTNSPM